MFEEREVPENALLGEKTKRYLILECQGCNTTFIGIENSLGPSEYAASQFLDGATSRWEYLPEPKWRELPKWINAEFENAHGSLFQLIYDTYDAANRGAYILSAMGIRTCFDIAGEILGIDATFSIGDKISAMRSAGHISPRETQILEMLVDSGSAAAHRGWTPDKDDLGLLFDAFETFVHHAIVLPQNLDTLSERIPTRKSTKQLQTKR